jgi:hypothetical protein
MVPEIHDREEWLMPAILAMGEMAADHSGRLVIDELSGRARSAAVLLRRTS